MNDKTVFLSYRRDLAGKHFAGRIHDALRHEGYDPFLDVYHLRAGNWEQQIVREVPARAHFLLVLTPGAIEGFSDPDDWMRREYEAALASRRNIVPIREASVSLESLRSNCPEDVHEILRLQMLELSHEGFANGVEQLVRDYIRPGAAPSPIVLDHLPSAPRRTLPALLRRNVFMGLIDRVLDLLVLAAFVLTAWQSRNDHWNDWLIPMAIIVKGVRLTASLSRGLRVFGFLAVFSLSGGMTLLLGNFRTKRELAGTHWIVPTLLIGFGAGLASVLAIVTTFGVGGVPREERRRA